MTNTSGNTVFPPLAAAQLAGFFSFTAHLLFGYLDKKLQPDDSLKNELPKPIPHARSLCSLKPQRRKGAKAQRRKESHKKQVVSLGGFAS
jgi:hypothetical protein